jgi:hypothetical protein
MIISRIAVAIALGAAALVHAPGSLRAQAASEPCPYRECALRVEPRGLGTALVRGAEGEVVGRLGFMGVRPDLRILVSRSDSAVAHAERYQLLAPRGAVLAGIGSLLLAAPTLREDLGDGWVIGATLGGAASTIAGAILLSRAQRALVRSVWWHNEALAR